MTRDACFYRTHRRMLASMPPQRSRLTFVRGVWEKSEKPSNRYSWSSYSITVGLSVWNTNSEVSNGVCVDTLYSSTGRRS